MNKTTDTTLYSYGTKNLVTLEAAIAMGSELLEGAITLLYSPQACQIAILRKGQLANSSGNQIRSIQDIFEARIFNSNCELRWLNQADGNGRSIFLSESPLSLENFTEESKACESFSQKYIIWGEQARTRPKANGWQRLAEARIGKIDIPFDQPLQENQRLYLKTVEYLAADEEFGNFAVIEERLVQLEV